MPDVKECRSCLAPIFWGYTGTGKKIPVDVKHENRLVITDMQDGVPVLEVRKTYVSHFATCPHAAEHRRK